MSKPKTARPIRLIRIHSAVPHIAMFSATSASVDGVTYRVWMNLQTGACTCSCPAYSTHCQRKARDLGVVQNLSRRYTLCKHCKAALDVLDETGEVVAVLDTGHARLRVEVA